MVNILYAVASFTCALVALILPVRVTGQLRGGGATERAFLRLIRWTALFCLADGFWGVAASELVMSDALLTILSTVFHTLASLTPAVWLDFVLTYLGEEKRKGLYRGITGGLILVELILIGINLFNGMMFYVDADGAYSSTPMRKLLFYMQYLTYVVIGVFSVVNQLRERAGRLTLPEGAKGHDYWAVLLFVAAPILCGVFQMIYPDAPAYSIGYLLGVCVIYSFVLTGMLHEQAVESARAEAASEAKTAFLFNMSHDIRTPMNAIIGFTNMARKNPDDRAKVADCLGKIQESSGLLLSLINSILDMSRIESGKAAVDEKPGDIRHSFHNLDSTLGELARSRDIDLRFEIGNVSDPYIYVDYDRSNRIFINILSNGIKYTREGGFVRALCEQIGRTEDGERGLYRYTFEDNGIGMSEEFQKHVFEEFSREENSTTSGIQGTGLGLAVCKSFTELMGGTIECRSRQGVGTTFVVTLPLRLQTEEERRRFEAEAAAGTPHEGEPVGMELLAGRRALLVEDNELNREIATDLLEDAGLTVDSAENGAEAVARMREQGGAYYDFILMDIQMPILDGYGATCEIRALYPDMKAPIIAVSANAFAEDRAASLRAGMDDHIAKPIQLPELLGCLVKHL